MAGWRSAYHWRIAARPPDSSTGDALNGEGAAGAFSVVSVPEWSAVPALRGLGDRQGRYGGLGYWRVLHTDDLHNCRAG